MAVKKTKNQDSLEDFFAEDMKDDIEDATRVSFSIDTDTGKIVDESGPGLEEDHIQRKKDTLKDTEVIIEDETEDTDPSEEDTEEEDTVPDTSAADAAKKAIEAEKERKRREKKAERFRQLARERREAELRAAKLEETLNRTNAVYAKIQIDNLEKALTSLKKELQIAVENQDAEAIATANSKYLDTYQQLSEYKRVLPDAEKASETSKTKLENFDKEYAGTAVEEEAEYPEVAQIWMSGKEFIWDTAEYKKLTFEQRKQVYPIRKEMQSLLAALIREEGYSPEDEMLYEELDMRLAIKFPEYEGIASGGIDALNSGNKVPASKKTGTSGEMKKPRNVEEKTRSVPVKGSSSVGSSTPSTGNTVKVKLSRDDVSYWEKYLEPRGITLAEYAKQVKAFENE